MATPRLAIVVSHPIQYQAPWFRALAEVTDLHVFFCHQQDGAGQAAAGFGVAFDWDVPLLDGYQSSWLKNMAANPGVSHFGGCDTPEIYERLRDGRFDACIVSGWYLKSYVQALWACRRLGIRVLSRGDSHLGTGRSTAWTMAKYLPYRLLLGAFDAHLYVGQANREYLTHYGVPEPRLHFAPHFVDNGFFASRSARAIADGQAAQVRRTLDIPADAAVCLLVGKLIAIKRPADFVRGLASGRASGRDVYGLVVGSGSLGPEIEALAAQLQVPVRFAGFKNQTELPQYVAAADALVLCSESETWGLVVNEAMACGLPAVVSSTVGCAPDLIESGKTGYVFEKGDTDALSRALVRLLDDLGHDRTGVRSAVLHKIDQYTCEKAVRGTLNALGGDAVTRARLRPAQPATRDAESPSSRGSESRSSRVTIHG